jgi:hypothetical protein
LVVSRLGVIGAPGSRLESRVRWIEGSGEAVQFRTGGIAAAHPHDEEILTVVTIDESLYDVLAT